MPLYAYCPQSSCASKIAYDTVKPTVCPQCRKTFASAFAVAPAPVAPTARAAVVEDDPDDRPLGRTVTASRPSTTVIKSRPGRPEPTRLMNPPVEAAPQVVFPDDGADEEGEDIDPREVRRRARELAATIDTSTIQINVGDLDQGDKPIKGIGSFSFRDMWDAGAATRESAAKPAKVKGKTKPKARR